MCPAKEYPEAFTVGDAPATVRARRPLALTAALTRKNPSAGTTTARLRRTVCKLQQKAASLSPDSDGAPHSYSARHHSADGVIQRIPGTTSGRSMTHARHFTHDHG